MNFQNYKTSAGDAENPPFKYLSSTVSIQKTSKGSPFFVFNAFSVITRNLNGLAGTVPAQPAIHQPTSLGVTSAAAWPKPTPAAAATVVPPSLPT